MYFKPCSSLFAVFICLLFAHTTTNAQKRATANAPKSYKSLFWEISGNGLAKPSYLFGTMHISNKMVFHLSDSFYNALHHADVVAIELNPEQWQAEMPRVNKQSELFKYYHATYYADYLKETTFKEADFVTQLQAVMRYEPELNEQLMYRNESSQDNFQEDTYLDLYIYQTGKKLGKKTAGVETYTGSQRMAIEAMVDAAAERNKDKKTPRANADIYAGQLLQDAYRRGDLDMLDSINKITQNGERFTEKFLYKRNEIQAESMDSIIRAGNSLFVGVGAAHLPGKRGVIEILRSKGYTLRPIYMQDRDAGQKQWLDTLTAPVTFTRQYANDSLFSVEVPGHLNELGGNGVSLKHFADMSNGSYYLITRFNTQSLFNGHSRQRLLQITDSLLYENIPGNIVSKKELNINGYMGFDITNRTKKGDYQRYQILVAPTEMIFFKMGGKGRYVQGREAATFFGSVNIKELPKESDWQTYSPASGGFAVSMPAKANQVFMENAPGDHLPEWRYESVAPGTDNHYAVFRKTIYSFDYIGADTFDLYLMMESFAANANWPEKKPPHKSITFNNRPAREISFKAKDGSRVVARAVLFGSQYYLLAYRGEDNPKLYEDYFKSFSFKPFQYPAATTFTDTLFHFTVQTPEYPKFDDDVQDMLMYVKRNESLLKKKNDYNGSADIGTSNFISNATGEVIVVNSLQYPRYHYVKDSAQYWKGWIEIDSSLIVKKRQYVKTPNGGMGLLVDWTDTATTRILRKLVLHRGMEVLTASTMLDTTLPQSAFLESFYRTFDFTPQTTKDTTSIFRPKQAAFFADYYSKDTTVSGTAKAALPTVYYGAAGYPKILEAINNLNKSDKDYYETKSKFIDELGYLRDSTVADNAALELQQFYEQAGDTTVFQNSALLALSRLRTGKATEIFKEMILQDPPAFEGTYEYQNLFSAYEDTLKLAAKLYPELMNLSTIQDFKAPVRQLLGQVVDSNYLNPELYENYVGNIFFDAKIAYKKLQNANESTNGDYGNAITPPDANNSSVQDLGTYVELLAPFYGKNQNLPSFFNKLLLVNNDWVRLNTALALQKNKQPVSDTVWAALARNKDVRANLMDRLQQLGNTNLVPAAYSTPQAVAEGILYNKIGSLIDSSALLQKENGRYEGKTVQVFYYKIRLKSSAEWRQAMVAIGQEKGNLPTSAADLFALSEGKIKDTPAALKDQQDVMWKKMQIGRRASGRQFYDSDKTTSGFESD
ncbi:MAG: TraB/GumN family protein [Edaphocola sp.]